LFSPANSSSHFPEGILVQQVAVTNEPGVRGQAVRPGAAGRRPGRAEAAPGGAAEAIDRGRRRRWSPPPPAAGGEREAGVR